jgi:hypothetical protein
MHRESLRLSMVFTPYTLPQKGRFRHFRSLFNSQGAKCRLRNGYITLEQANRYYGLDKRSASE